MKKTLVGLAALVLSAGASADSVVLNGQLNIVSFQGAGAANVAVLAGGDVSANATNAVNTANITSSAVALIDADSFVGSLQVSGLALQGSTAGNLLVASGGDINTNAVNAVNTTVVDSEALSLIGTSSIVLNGQVSVAAGQDANAFTILAFAPAGNVTTAAQNTVNLTEIDSNAETLFGVTAFSGVANVQVAGITGQSATAVTVGAIAGGAVSTSATNSINSATITSTSGSLLLP